MHLLCVCVYAYIYSMKTKTLSELKDELETLSTVMPYSYAQQRFKNQQMFVLSREIERLENPEAYEQNKGHWDNHEIRL